MASQDMEVNRISKNTRRGDSVASETNAYFYE